jgi:hypothetical protein
MAPYHRAKWTKLKKLRVKNLVAAGRGFRLEKSRRSGIIGGRVP